MKQTHSRPVKNIQREIFRILLLLVTVLTLLLACVSTVVNIGSESSYLDQNLQNTARAIAASSPVRDALRTASGGEEDPAADLLHTYLDSLKESLSNIDVISVVTLDSTRKYHTNPDMIGTFYDGTLPTFPDESVALYVTNDTGPSGSQRRAYAAVYDDDGSYLGFVLAVMLNQNIHRIILNTVLIHLGCFVSVVLLATVLSRQLSLRIKEKLHGYEPDTFSAMFTIRENVLDSLDEGIIAVGVDEKVIYTNKAALRILGIAAEPSDWREIARISPTLSLTESLRGGVRLSGLSIRPSSGTEALVDTIPIAENDRIVGALCILRDRTEYTKLMEDLSGVRYMVESMRANNHDFVNKLHVILGLIRMGRVDEAGEYITHIASIQQAVLSNIIKNIEDPSVAALLIGKYARASELNIQFSLKSGSRLSRSDIALPSGDLVTVIGNLLDNAMDSMNEKSDLPKDLSIGIYSQPRALLITVDDTGMGIADADRPLIFRNGFSTKGSDRGTGLFLVNNIVEKLGGTISVESESGAGTCFTVTIAEQEHETVRESGEHPHV